MKNTIIFGVVGLLIVGGIIFANTGPKKEMISSQNSPSPSISVIKSTKEKTITMTEVEKHNAESDCWIVVNNKVYDSTSYIAQGQHPPVIIESCGKDGTDAFNTQGEKNSPHSDEAKQLLSTFYKGLLAK